MSGLLIPATECLSVVYSGFMKNEHVELEQS